MIKTIQIARRITRKVNKIIVFKPNQPFSINSRGFGPKQANKLVWITFYGFKQNKQMTYEQKKLNLIVTELNQMRNKFAELETQINQANSERENIEKQISLETEKVRKLKRIMKDTEKPNPQDMKQLQKIEGRISQLNMNIAALDRQLMELNQNKVQLKKQMSKLGEDLLSKNNNSYLYYWQIIAIIAAATLFFGVLSYFNQDYFAKKSVSFAQRQDQETRISKQDQALIKYFTNTFDKDLMDYIQGSSIQKKMRQYIDPEEKQISQNHQKNKNKSVMAKQNKVLLITGSQGVGKTTAVKYIIKELRMKKKDVYYINLRDDHEKIVKKALDLENLLYGIKNKYKNENMKDRKVKLIIDDVDMLQKLDTRLSQYDNLLHIFTSASLPYLQVICISSSSKFTQKIIFDSYYSAIPKLGQFFVLQDLKEQEYEIFTKSLINKYCQNVTDKIINHMIKQKYSARDITDIKSSLNLQKSEQKKLNFLIENEKDKFNNLKGIFSNILMDNNSDIVRILTQKLIDSPQQLTMNNCNKIKNEITDVHGKTLLIKSIIEKLSDSNMLIFCRPRSQAHRNVFKKVLLLLKEQSQENTKEINQK